jgi:hypothetical protein
VKAFAALLLAAWAALLAIPTAQASTIVDQVDIIDGRVDVNESGTITTLDDATDVLLFFNDAAPIRVDIIDGLVDVTEHAGVTTFDDLSNFDLNDLEGMARTSNQMDIIDGFVDVTENGIIEGNDDATDVQLVRLVSSLVYKVDIIDGEVDVNEDGTITSGDQAPAVLLALDEGALIRGEIVSGKVYVPADPDWLANALLNVDLNDLVGSTPSSNQVDILNGLVDVTEGGVINTGDDATDVKLVSLNYSQLYWVQIIDGLVDANLDGGINSVDDLNNVLLLFDDAAPIRVDIIDGRVDVTESGVISILDDLPNTDLVHVIVDVWSVDYVRNQVDIIDGKIDVDEDGSITTADDLLGDSVWVQLLVP